MNPAGGGQRAGGKVPLLARHDRRIAVGLFIVAFVTFAWFFGGGGWNQNAHFDLTRALVERQTLHVDGYDNSGDVSSSGGHVYINKPPGASVLAAIPYAILYGIERAFGIPLDSWLVTNINGYLVTLFTCGLAGALIPVVLYAYARRRVNATPVASVAVALTIAFGTIVFPYSTIFFAHVPSALFLLLAFVWLDERPLLAGAAAGVAGACFYFCIPAAVILAIAAGRKFWRVAAGGAPFAILIAAYQYACFGSPFTTPLEISTQFTEENLLFGVIRRTSLGALWGITFAESHGLFFVSPVLLLVVAGAIVMVRRRILRRELAVIGAIAMMFLLVTASFNAWHGGHAFGPRYVLSMIPLLAIPLMFAPLRAIVPLAIVSAAMQLLATAVNPMPPNVERPVREFLWPAFMTGKVPLQMAHQIGYPDAAIGKVAVNPQSIDEYCASCRYPVRSREGIWASFNLGELILGPSQRVTIIPIALWMISGSLLLIRLARR